MRRSDPKVVLEPASCAAVVFDMDGVLTDTARVHAAAWKQTFDEYLESRAQAGGERARKFDDDEDYRRYVDGKPRYDGVRSFLASRGIELDEGDPGDPPDRQTVCGLGNRKNRLFLERLREHGAERFEDAVELIRRLGEAGIRTGAISASRNAKEVLEAAGMSGLLEARVDGAVADEVGLAGKPAPDTLLEAARRLGAAPRRCAIVEDAEAGVEAGRAAGFGWVIGIARDGGGGGLEASGATVVVRDLSEVGVESGGGTSAAPPSAKQTGRT